MKLPETLRPGEPSHARRHWLNLQGWKSAVRVPGVPLAILIFFLGHLRLRELRIDAQPA